MKTRTFESFSDPSHGWIKVPKTLLVELGIANKISHCSYMKVHHAYLEEDADATTFMQAMAERGIQVKFRHRTADRLSRIRNYPGYLPGVQHG